MNKSGRRIPGNFLRCVALAMFVGASGGYAKTIAFWDFSEGATGTDVVSAPDSVSGLTAIPAVKNTSIPQYVAGKNNGSAVKVGPGSMLEVTDNSGVLGAGFSELYVSFDVDLAADVTSGTQIFLRNGHNNVPFNIFIQSSNVIGVILQGADGTFSSTIKTAGSALSTSAGWQTVSVAWNGSSLSISVDGAAQRLTAGGTAAKISGLSSLIKADAPMGIGGLRRVDGSIGQFLDGSLDNIEIHNKTPTLPSFGLLFLLLKK